MYPPKVEDKEVLAVIRDLSGGGALPSGAAVRAALARRYGSRGGVTRIYRLLASERTRRGTTTLSAVGAGRKLQRCNVSLQSLRRLMHGLPFGLVQWDRKNTGHAFAIDHGGKGQTHLSQVH